MMNAHGGVVEVPEDRQQSAVASPQGFGPQTTPMTRAGGAARVAKVQPLALTRQRRRPESRDGETLGLRRRELQQRRGLREKTGVGDREVPCRVQKPDPETVLDHIGGDLTVTDWAANEAAHEEQRVIEQEAVTALGGDWREGREGVAARRGAIGRQGFDIPVRREEEVAQPGHPIGAERVDVQVLVNGRLMRLDQPVDERATGILEGAARGDLARGRARRRLGADHPEEAVGRVAVDMQSCVKEVLEEIARHELLAPRRTVEEILPRRDLRAGGGAPARTHSASVWNSLSASGATP